MKQIRSSSEENANEQISADSAVATKRNESRRAFLRNTLVSTAVAAPVAGLLAINTVNAAPTWNTTNFLPTSQAFKEIRSDENAHVAFLKKALMEAGVKPRPEPTFKNLTQPNVRAFELLSRTFENVGVGAYLFAAPKIKEKVYLSAAASILTIEARHAGYLDALTDVMLSPNGPFDKPIPQAQIVRDISPFIKSLNGGPDPSKPLKSDTDILNFALLLEYLEATFYNINVPRFF